MKKRVLALALLVAVLTGCAGQDASSPVTGGAAWSFPEGPAPAEEYERFFWYGFGEENPDRDPSAAATEKEMADMLAAVIEAAGGDVEGWRELTAHASDEGIYRDYCAMFLLYAAEHMDATEFTMGFAPYLWAVGRMRTGTPSVRTSGAVTGSLKSSVKTGIASASRCPARWRTGRR